MKRSELRELYYITPIENLQSIFSHGLLSYRRSESVKSVSLANPNVQFRRGFIMTPDGQSLHEFVNLYFSARNPMLFTLVRESHKLCVLSISPKIVDEKDVWIVDRNAASDDAQFHSAGRKVWNVDYKAIVTKNWSEAKARKCAEVLVPDRVQPHFVVGVYVRSEPDYDMVREQLEREQLKREQLPRRWICLKRDMFFDKG